MARARPRSARSQQGAVIVTACLFMFLLLGFMGIALDLGRAYLVKSELQSALDSCALSAAQELDGAPDAITRATSAGLSAGNLNGVYFQSGNWAGHGQLGAGDVAFLDAGFLATTASANARYVECTHTQPNQATLLRALNVFWSSAGFPTSLAVSGRAVATRASAQTACPVPLALKPRPGGTVPNHGYSVGEWVTLVMAPGGAIGGQVGWANLDGSSNAAETVAELGGYCGTAVGDTLGTPGVQATVADNWNSRFGIYKNTGDPSQPLQRPDYTGYAYTLANWPSGANAYDGATPAGAHATAANFVAKRAAFASCADTGTQLRGAPDSCEGISGLDLNSFQKLAAPGLASGGHRQYGGSRRIVLVPVVDGASKVIDYACMLMLQPLSIPLVDVQLEFRGNAGTPGSPCATNGLAGGTAGPLVPVLVR
jgi:hypothetical protein